MTEGRDYSYELRHKSTFAFPISKLLRLAVRIFPSRLKSLSERKLVVGQHKCFFASEHNSLMLDSANPPSISGIQVFIMFGRYVLNA